MRSARERERALETESEKVSERKAVCRKLNNTRERARCMCKQQRGARLSGVANAVCKEKSLSLRVQYA